MNFYDIPEKALPQDTKYYFNVLVISIGVDPAKKDEYFPQGIESIWYLDELTNARPRVFHIYVDEEFDADELEFEFLPEDEEFEGLFDIELDDYSLEILPHQVVEIHPTLGISLYDMLDFDTDDAWEI